MAPTGDWLCNLENILDLEFRSMKSIPFAIAVAALAATAAPAQAHHKHHYAGHHHTALAVDKVHYGGRPGVGYWRRGPASGYGFGFSSYRGDPFGADDYYDGDRCYYIHHRDFCVAHKIFTGFR